MDEPTPEPLPSFTAGTIPHTPSLGVDIQTQPIRVGVSYAFQTDEIDAPSSEHLSTAAQCLAVEASVSHEGGQKKPLTVLDVSSENDDSASVSGTACTDNKLLQGVIKPECISTCGDLRYVKNSICYHLNSSVLHRFLDILLERFHLKGYGVSLSFVDVSTMRELCQEYLSKNAPTDILSFPQLSFVEPISSSAFPNHSTDHHIDAQATPHHHLGDIVVCLAEIEDMGIVSDKMTEYSLAYNVLFIITHGFLHLGGHDHIPGETSEVMMKRYERETMDYLSEEESRIIEHLFDRQQRI